MRYNQVGARARHGFGFVLIEDIRGGKQIQLVGCFDHVNLEAKAHAGLFQVLSEHAVAQTHSGKVLHTGEPYLLDLFEEQIHHAEGICSAYAGQHGRVLDHRQNFIGHFHDDAVGVAVGHTAGQRTSASHAKAP